MVIAGFVAFLLYLVFAFMIMPLLGYISLAYIFLMLSPIVYVTPLIAYWVGSVMYSRIKQ